jgi:hypothetical protein
MVRCLSTLPHARGRTRAVWLRYNLGLLRRNAFDYAAAYPLLLKSVRASARVVVGVILSLPQHHLFLMLQMQGVDVSRQSRPYASNAW